MQHSDAGGLSDAPRSPSGIVAGRWNTHTLSCESTATPPTCPVTHLFGNACDHSGSGSNIGTCPARLCAHTDTPTRSATMTTMYLFMRLPLDTRTSYSGSSLLKCALIFGGASA